MGAQGAAAIHGPFIYVSTATCQIHNAQDVAHIVLSDVIVIVLHRFTNFITPERRGVFRNGHESECVTLGGFLSLKG